MRNNKTWSTYPWWLLLVGFAFGVLVMLWATQGRTQTVTVYRDAGRLDEILVQATQMLAQATQSAIDIQQAAMSNHATANALAAPMQAAAVDPLLATATAIVMQATQQASP